MRDVAVISFAQTRFRRREVDRDETELVQSVVFEALERAGLFGPSGERVGFTCSGSCDFLTGRPFSFVGVVDALGAWPPIEESHVEMDGAWALYEAWVRLQHGDVDTALVYAFGKSSAGDLPRVMTAQLDPYLLGPLGPDAIALAALQARAVLDAGGCDERRWAGIASTARRRAIDNPYAQVRGDFDVEALLAESYLVSPLRKHDCPPISDGAAAVVLAVGDTARRLCPRPAWIRGIDHRIDAHSLGARDLTRSASTALAARHASHFDGQSDVAEIHAPFTSQHGIIVDALGLGDATDVNPSGGALAANPMMVAGLVRIGEAARAISERGARRATAHATSGPCLQQNLVAVLEAR